MFIHDPIPDYLTMDFVKTGVFPIINMVCAAISISVIAYHQWKHKYTLPEAAISIVPLVVVSIAYGLFGFKVIDQTALSNLVRPALPPIILSIAISTFLSIKRHSWTKESKSHSKF